MSLSRVLTPCEMLSGWYARGRQSIVQQIPGRIPLDDQAWERRHRCILPVLALHVFGFVLYGLCSGGDALHRLVEASSPALGLAIALGAPGSRRIRAIATSLGLMLSSALLVHLSGGLVDMHFHFFVMIAIVALYQSWPP